MKILLFVFLFFGSMTSELAPTNISQSINLSIEVENYDPCGCDADLQECIQNSPPGSGCIQEYVQCSIACRCLLILYFLVLYLNECGIYILINVGVAFA